MICLWIYCYEYLLLTIIYCNLYFQFATKMGTVNLNFNNRAFINEFGMHLMKTSRPIYNRLTVFVIGHALLSFAITYYQMKNIEFLSLKMLEQQNEEIERLQKINNKTLSH